MMRLKMQCLVRTGRLKSLSKDKKSSLKHKKKQSSLPSKRELGLGLLELTVNDKPVTELAEVALKDKPSRELPSFTGNDTDVRRLSESTAVDEENVIVNMPEFTEGALKHGEKACRTKSKGGEASNEDVELLEFDESDEDNGVLPEISVCDEIPTEKSDAGGTIKTCSEVACGWGMQDQVELAGIKRMCLPQRKLAPDKIVIPDDWRAAADFITDNASHQQSVSGDCLAAPPPIVVICGVQNVGKSTFARFLVNTLLRSYKKVGYLDTDVGQPEFTPPGCVSLHIVNKPNPDLAVLCLRTPERCYFYGDVSPKADPQAYLCSIVKLYDYFRKEYYISETSNECELLKKDQIPLVVNTHGWVKGIGYDVLVDMLRYMVPTHVVQIRLSAISKNLPFGTFWSTDSGHESSAKLIYLHTGVRDSMNKSVVIQKHGRQMRELRIIAYFRQCFIQNSEKITTYKELARALACHPPFQVPIPSIKVVHLHCQVPASEIYYSLNGTIVGLAVSSKHCNKTAPDDSQPVCVGLGIVRGVDVFKDLFYVITPIPISTLQNVDTFLQGFIEIPVSVLQTPGFICPYMSAYALPTEGTGGASVKCTKQRDKKRDTVVVA